MASAVLEEEVPCRDTDPLPSKDQDSNRDSPVAFTINFGLGDEDAELSKEKAKKLERFALRSSLRKPKSPRLPQSNSPSNNSSNNNNNNMVKSGGLVREKSNLSFRGSYRAKSAVTTATSNSSATTNSPTTYQQHSVMKTPSAKAAYRKDSSSSMRHNETMSKMNQHSNSMLSSARDHSTTPSSRDQNAVSRDRFEKSSSRHNNDSADARRRLTTTLSPEEAKMISHFEKEIEAHSLEIVERSYEDDEFELETESCPSETGTYTVGKDEEKKNQTAASEEKARYELENLVGENQTRNNYVQDWANRHAAHHTHTNRHSPDTSASDARGSPISHGHRARVSRGVSAPSLRPTLIPTPPLGAGGMCGGDDDGDLSPQPLGSGGATANSLSKSRRRLPATPGGVSSTPVSGIMSPESNPEFSPSTDSPSPTQESDEGENSYMKHTQHLVNVMEARINQVSGHTTSTSRAIKTSTIVKKKSTTTLPSTDGVSAKEAWERRKNYDPLMASGRKKEAITGRKSSSSSMGRSPREDIKSGSDNARYEERGSAKSASSDSSGYFSRGEVGAGQAPRHPSLNRGDGGRFSMRGNPHKLKAISKPGVVSSKPANKPQSKLLASDKQNSRSSSCLTSKEAEFQAWKRRKNYDPLKSATASAVGIRNGGGNRTIRENGNSAPCGDRGGNSSLIGSRRSNGGDSDSAGGGASGAGRFSGTSDNGGRFARSPRNAYAPSPTPHHHQQGGTIQHKRVQEMSQSLIHGGAGSRGSHHVASTSDQPPPMQRSASFHYENIRMRGASNGNSGETDHHQLRMYSLQGTHPDDFARGGMRGNTSEDESTEDYGSGCDSSNAEGVPRHYYLDEDELILPIYPSSSHRSIYNRSLSPKPSPSRSRSRLEALDNLVISTIYSVSSKLCNNTQSILKRAGLTFPPTDEDQATTLETVLYLLEDVDLPCSPAKKTSRELSGTLRNLKKVEQALEVLHKLIESDQDD